MITTNMVLHQWLRIRGMIGNDATTYSALPTFVKNDPLLTSLEKCVVAEVTT